MRKSISLMVVGVVSLLLFGCAGGKFIKPVSTSAPDEELLWSTHEKGRPIWTVKPSEEEKDFLFFVGESESLPQKKGQETLL